MTPSYPFGRGEMTMHCHCRHHRATWLTQVAALILLAILIGGWLLS